MSMSYDMTKPWIRLLFEPEFRKAAFKVLREGRGTIEMLNDVEFVFELMQRELVAADEMSARERKKKQAERRRKRETRLDDDEK